MQHPDDSDDLVEWCENNLNITDCSEDLCEVCPVYGIYYALHPLLRGHIFNSPDMNQMRSELDNLFRNSGDSYDVHWREKYVMNHQSDHMWELDECNLCPEFQEEEEKQQQEQERQKIMDELILYAKMEELELEKMNNVL